MNAPRIAAEALYVHLGQRTVLAGPGFEVAPGKFTALIGPNGSGKTTLLRAIGGLLPYSGSLTLAGREVAAWPARELARTLAFVRDNGQEAFETQVDLDKPYELTITYVPFMFNNYLLEPKPKRVLIVGLGGGSMIHFLKRYDPEVKIDSVEIDPAVVEIAKKYFNVPDDDNVKLMAEDGLKYLESTDAKYDVIYMDAFLKPSADTDKTGAPTRDPVEALAGAIEAALLVDDDDGIELDDLSAANDG